MEIKNDFDSIYIKNIGSNMYLALDQPDIPETVWQKNFSYGGDRQWKIQRQLDGYYTIKSMECNVYLGISQTFLDLNLYENIYDNSKWKIYSNNEKLFFVPKLEKGKALCAIDREEESEYRLCTISLSDQYSHKF